MGRLRQPTKLLELSGAIKHDPQRYRDRADEPRPSTSIGDPPAEFLGAPHARHRELWREFIAEAPKGVLTGCDRYLLANACRIQVLIEQGACTMSMHSQLRRYMLDMGMTLSGRRMAEQTPKGTV